MADPSRHAKKEILVSGVYCWEHDCSALADIQRILPGRMLLDSEVSMTEEIRSLTDRGRLERVATYRFIQALSNTVSLLDLPGLRGFDSFILPEGVNLRPLERNEQYVLRPSETHGLANAAHIFNIVTKEITLVFENNEPSTFDPPLLVINLDQGSIGSAAQAFADHQTAMVHSKWDHVHRSIRDVRGCIDKSSNALFLKAQVYSGYIFGLNCRPFNSGAFGDLKRRLLNVLYASSTIESPIFKKYGRAIARDLNMRFVTIDERIEVWEKMGTLKSFNGAMETPKMGRWFSWNGAARDQIKEWHTVKMVCEFSLQENDTYMDPDAADALPFDHKSLEAVRNKENPVAQLRAMKMSAGGLQLCYSLMSSMLLLYTKAVYYLTQATWTWYTDRVTNVKSPRQNIILTLGFSGGKWRNELHFRETVRIALFDPTTLSELGLAHDNQSEVGSALLERLHESTVSLIGQRAWSFAVRYGLPPEIYVGILSSVARDKAEAAALMESHWHRLRLLERVRHLDGGANILWADLTVARNTPIRTDTRFFLVVVDIFV